MSDRLRLADLLGGLSIVADLGFALPPEEAMRSCLIAAALARRLGLAEPDVADTFYTALLMHVGCSSQSHGDQLAEEGPAGRYFDGVGAGVASVADAAWTRQPQ